MAMRKKGLSQSGSGEAIGEVSEGSGVQITQLQRMLARGIPVIKASFAQAIDNGNNVPCEHLSTESHNAERKAEMWWTGDGLLCKQKDKWFFAPSGNVIHCRFLNDKD